MTPKVNLLRYGEHGDTVHHSMSTTKGDNRKKLVYGGISILVAVLVFRQLTWLVLQSIAILAIIVVTLPLGISSPGDFFKSNRLYSVLAVFPLGLFVWVVLCTIGVIFLIGSFGCVAFGLIAHFEQYRKYPLRVESHRNVWPVPSGCGLSWGFSQASNAPGPGFVHSQSPPASWRTRKNLGPMVCMFISPPFLGLCGNAYQPKCNSTDHLIIKCILCCWE